MKAHRFYLDERYSEALMMWKEAAVRAERMCVLDCKCNSNVSHSALHSLGSAHRETVFAWANIGHVLFQNRNTEDAYIYLLKCVI